MSKYTTTIKKIKAADPYLYGRVRLPVNADKVSLETIFELNNLGNTLFVLKLFPEYANELRLLACNFADTVSHLVPDNMKQHIEIAKSFALGEATASDLIRAKVESYKALKRIENDWIFKATNDEKRPPVTPMRAALAAHRTTLKQGERTPLLVFEAASGALARSEGADAKEIEAYYSGIFILFMKIPAITKG